MHESPRAATRRKRAVRAVVYGIGTLNQIATRLMIDKGVDIVAAINRPGPKVGRDLGEIAGLGYSLGVPIRDDASAILHEVEADIALVGVFDDMERMESIYTQCLQAGLNVITFGAHASYPWRIAPEVTGRLDQIAKQHAVTITGSGNQDVFMVHLGVVLSGACHRIDSVIHHSASDVNVFGAEVARLSSVGATPEQYCEHTPQGSAPGMSVYTTFWENFAADLGLTVRSVTQRSDPVLAEREMFCTSLGVPVAPGRIAGIVEHISVETAEGITMQGDYRLVVLAEGEQSYKAWSFRGDPDIDVRADGFDIGLTTAIQPVNRIPDVLEAPPGYVTLERLPKLKYRPGPFSIGLHD